ncbi:ABC transporter ATP-binding protein [Variovorax boronicumulans]|uniref:ABC transporter ATP-binding protein n=1 Tax=Variovorax boronicumulans TaxID=436515 RepID=UPI00277FC594|nr:ATP-binding cassette domain-containing protein [Variovorax boronicumulans]MDQ0041056.1 peptide/nickel transport system ATP-binding protein [Variovorax boronicumulans]
MTASVLLAADNLGVHVGTRALLRDVSFSLRAGEVLTLLGESGAGKSLLAQAVMGNLPAALRASGSVTLDGAKSRADDARARRPRWGRTVALLPQEPSLALDPLMRIAPQLSETHELVRGAAFDQAEAAALHDLDAAGLTASARQYPWQLSGGMAQRAAAAVACAGGARILLADEPTKGLDAHWRDHTVAMLQGVQRRGGCVVVITHDLRVAEALGGQLIVLCAGQVVERGDARTVLADPQHAFTRRLVAADPARWPRRAAAPASAGAPVLSAQGLSKGFGGKPLFDGVDLQIRAGDRFVVQGPSGTGKSTLGNVLLGLMPADRGVVRRAEGLHATAFQKLYQDPVASFAPHVTLGQSLRDVAARHRCAWPAVLQHLTRMGVPHDLLARRPSQVSGGELQRVALARVLTVQPALVFADEPTSRLDPVSQQEAMAVLLDALDERGAALMLVTHDDDIADAVATQRWRIAAG